jgi:uncharacterized protein YegP (UPF0339 family)
MSKFVRALALVAAMAVVSAAAFSVAEAQDKGKEKKAEKIGTIEVYKGKDGYRFRVKGTDGKNVIQSSKGYQKKDDALKALEFVKETLAKGKVTEIDDEK